MNRIEAARKACEILDDAGYTTRIWTKEATKAGEGKEASGTHIRVYVAKTKLNGSKGDDLGYIVVADKLDISSLWTGKGGLWNHKEALDAISVDVVEVALPVVR